ncbi:CpeT/CpcT family [Algoriphagus alkaliphilus]|uniref:CpeT/CpcT family n=2 Tax=Algoriphagus alkaliphilus TaxID=279824 RepID=A0A1G5VED5_9BACT|nr:hypothetical protein [Cyclobacterium sp.]SDA44281.1 CpeT/CpcT family [Algoriphagus alkaliphilus]
MMKKICFCLTGLVFLIVLSVPMQASAQSDLLQKFLGRFAGTYSSERMASENPSRVHVILTIKPIWKDRSDGAWFYLEQAAYHQREVPYRTAVLKVFEQDGKIISRNYTFENKDIFLDGEERPFPIERFSPSALDAKYCDILFEVDFSGNFVGKTPDGGCQNSFKGAQVFTNESYLTKEFLISRDRGWSQEGKQLWGPEDFGYLFEKIE